MSLWRAALFAVLPLAIAVVLAVVLWPGGSDDAPAGEAGEVGKVASVTIATAISVPSLDAQLASSRPQASLLNAVFDGLVRRDPQEAAWRYALATDGTMSSDGSRLALDLRDGVTCHDGSEFTARDVVFSIRRLIDPDTPAPNAGPIREWVEGVRALDPGRVELSLRFPQWHSWEWRLDYPMFCARAFRQLGEEQFGQEPVGTGPFRVDSFRVNDSLTLRANAEYWDGPPNVETVTMQFVGDTLTRLNLLRNGEVDMVDGMSPEALARLPEANFNTANIPSGVVLELRFNTRAYPDSPWAEKQVRQAMNYAVDRQGLADALYDGGATVVPAILPSELKASDSGLSPYPYDPERARSMLADAGHADGFSFTLAYPLGNYLNGEDSVTAVAGQLEEVGIEAELQPLDVSVWGPRVVAPERPTALEVTLHGMSNYTGDPLYSYGLYVDSSSPVSAHEMPEVDRLTGQLAGARTEEERLDLSRRIERILHEEAPFLFLFELPTGFAWSKSVPWTASPSYRVITPWLINSGGAAGEQ